MVHATEFNTGAAGVAANTNGNRETGDATLFANELQARLEGGTETDRIARGMDRLAGAFPGIVVSSSSFGTFESMATCFITLDAGTTLTISPSLMAEAGENDETFEKIRNMVGGLFAAGGEQALVDAGGVATQRHVVVDEATTRYVEVRRDENGRALSITALAFETQRMIAETLNTLLAKHQTGGRETVSAASPAEFLFPQASGTSSRRGFQGVVSATGSWRLEGVVTGAGLVNAGNAASQTLFASQRVTMELRTLVEGWEIEGEGKIDLFTYMQVMGLTDPLVFDLEGEGINLTSAEEGVYFDIRGDGTPVRTGWIGGGNAFLYLDGNGNGVVDDAHELFGDHGGFANGFAKLAQYDGNGDGVIDEKDAVYGELRLWRDANGDGVTQAGESVTLAEAGIAAIDLGYEAAWELDGGGNVIGERSTFTRVDGTTGLVADAWLRSER